MYPLNQLGRLTPAQLESIDATGLALALRDALVAATVKVDELEAKIAHFDPYEKRVEEQIYFARETIVTIKVMVEESRSVGQARRAVATAIENSYFEL